MFSPIERIVQTQSVSFRLTKWIRKDLEHRIRQDIDFLLRTLWRHQVMGGNEPVEDWRLCEMCDMSSNWYEMILYFVLKDFRWGVVRFSSGRIGYK